jgi:BirA family transcriptional regulator, biotin operon repressor / biotin---[acetyl-CoA-carboxylase] ligase
LIETCAVGNQRFVVIGVGINITEPQADQTLPALQLRRPPAWLQELIPSIDAPDVLLRIAPDLVQTLLVFAEQGFAPFQTRFHARDVLRDRQISVDDNLANTNDRTSGIALGVNRNGELEIQTMLGKKTINSSEVSISPL